MNTALLLQGRVNFTGDSKIEAGYITFLHTASGIESDTYHLEEDVNGNLNYNIDVSKDSWLCNTNLVKNSELSIGDNFIYNVELISIDNSIYIGSSNVTITYENISNICIEHDIILMEENRLTHGSGRY